MDVRQSRRPVAVLAALVPVTLALALAMGVAAQPERATGQGGATPEGGLEGTLRILTYNVAGLPSLISKSKPELNIPRMAPLMAGFDVVLVQEDFAFQEELRRGMKVQFASRPSGSGRWFDLGDGLNRFAKHAVQGHLRRRWRGCHGVFGDGSDCLGSKGFSVAAHRLAPGVWVDVYNVHLDGGRSAEDREVRKAQIDQLVEMMSLRPDRGVVVGGDTNLWAGEEGLVERLLSRGRLRDACRDLDCEQPQRIDRVLFRDGGGTRFAPRRWRVDRRFVDEGGAPLSDHHAIAVELDWVHDP